MVFIAKSLMSLSHLEYCEQFALGFGNRPLDCLPTRPMAIVENDLARPHFNLCLTHFIDQ
jgi:hypothetical protein